MQAILRQAEEEVAQLAYNKVQQRLGKVLQHPTGYYQSRIKTERKSGGYSVNDGRIIYGPWLEGVGSRNRTTRFKGYATFRIVAGQVRAEAEYVIEEVVRRNIGRLN